MEKMQNSDDETAKIEGYSSPVTSSFKSRLLRDKSDEELDDEEFEKLLSRPARRLFPLFESPEFVQRLRAYDEVDVGSSVTFIAQYRAKPTPTVKWFKDEEEVRATGRHRLDSDDVDGVIRLTINDVVASDEGAYKCKVENREGVASTTGYLSVAGRPSRSRGTRTAGGAGGKNVNGSLSTASPCGTGSPPYLGPIAEQKSMEEREEIELMRQPPSPLQQFIDNIRHSAKAKHAPIYYGVTDRELLNTITADPLDGNDAFNEENKIGINEMSNWRTTDNNINDDKRYEHLHRSTSTRDSPSLFTTDGTQTSAASPDSFYDSDVDDPDFQSKSEVPGSSRVPETNSISRSLTQTRVFHRRRLGQLQLKHRLAIDLPETVALHDRHKSSLVHSERTTDTSLWSAWNDLDDVVWEMFVVFIVTVSCLALFLSIPPSWMMVFVAGSSLIGFSDEDRRKTRSEETTSRL